ncbi:uncharacterized protein E0L32_001854 [Thyridium curvatum]|uniref:Archaemetzincin-2 n=1 Tax=Thyridium curvatum TaxID=1093900 RepID=A0A507AVI2_9PEZI|nr:uncharacterized protein E0L32_001825 [Thyridium curvatum]XP_030989990.1 uncharacterized protein E0L32_001854 [Thyridium curvatum]TPX08250.1 hypothetical protein E0L32_001825 [Thyridium curvatum]TPX08279.1 hypothetical protein E0L32_001854 [Thyridium curvatum]
MSDCPHVAAYTGPSPYALECDFHCIPAQKRLAAINGSGRLLKGQSASEAPSSNTFPAPLALPGDELALDPASEPQSFRSFSMFKSRNRITGDRKTLYVIEPPVVTSEAGVMEQWSQPVVPADDLNPTVPADLSTPTAWELQKYLAAFYHGLEVKVANLFRWVSWTEGSVTNRSRHVGIATTAGSCFRVRARTSLDQVAYRQLNLDDILDAVIDGLPQDAYAVVLLVHHDLFEDEDDDFCCGRAYGGSRVSIVTSFRYHPCLDRYSGIDVSHMWPASHCRGYVDGLCGSGGANPTRLLTVSDEDMENPPPLAVAIRAAKSVLIPHGKQSFVGLWQSRVSRTVSHELAHCLAMGHCVYYACVMGGTTSIAEDLRQPPFLCPVCLRKLSYAVVGEASKPQERKEVESVYVEERYSALREYCTQGGNIGMLRGYGAWIDARLKELSGY